MKSSLAKTDRRKKPLILVDGMNVAIRYHYAMRLQDPKGFPTGMLYGTLRLVRHLQKDYPQGEIVFLWEGTNSLRKSKCSSYKSNRSNSNNYIVLCSQELQKALSYIGIKQVYCVGMEADDLAGYYVLKYSYRKQIILYSNDSDWWQYFKNNVKIRNSKGFYSYASLKSTLGFPPEKIWMFKALKGDKTDNIKGIPRFPADLAVYLCNICEKIEEMYMFMSHYTVKKESHKKWIFELVRNKFLLERNVELIKYQPRWITPSKIISIPKVSGRRGSVLLDRLLKKRNIKSL